MFLFRTAAFSVLLAQFAMTLRRGSKQAVEDKECPNISGEYVSDTGKKLLYTQRGCQGTISGHTQDWPFYVKGNQIRSVLEGYIENTKPLRIRWSFGGLDERVKACFDISGTYLTNSSTFWTINQVGCQGQIEGEGSQRIQNLTVDGGAVTLSSGTTAVISGEPPFTIKWSSGAIFKPYQACADVSGKYLNAIGSKMALTQDRCEGNIDGGNWNYKTYTVVGNVLITNGNFTAVVGRRPPYAITFSRPIGAVWVRVEEEKPIDRDFCPQPPNTSLHFGEQGRVDWLYTFGTPSVAKSPLRHGATSDGVFPGVRIWQAAEMSLDTFVDLVPLAAALVGMVHPYIVAEVIVDGEMPLRFPIDDNVARQPRTLRGSVGLHDKNAYARIEEQFTRRFPGGCPTWSALSLIANRISYIQNVSEAQRMVTELGWQVLGDAFDPAGGFGIGGSQRSYLVQNPETLECVVTFQGTNEIVDWTANLAFFPVDFCGYASVHYGFVKQLRDMVQHESWQRRVRSKLGKCSAVYATGHSLGGALASLFTACMSHMQFAGQSGYGDLDYISWTRDAV